MFYLIERICLTCGRLNGPNTVLTAELEKNLMPEKFTMGALRAAKTCQSHIKSSSFSYSPEEAAAEIDRVLQLPAIITLMQELVEEAKRDLANSPNWTGNTVRVSKSHIKELSNLARTLSDEY